MHLYQPFGNFWYVLVDIIDFWEHNLNLNLNLIRHFVNIKYDRWTMINCKWRKKMPRMASIFLKNAQYDKNFSDLVFSVQLDSVKHEDGTTSYDLSQELQAPFLFLKRSFCSCSKAVWRPWSQKRASLNTLGAIPKLRQHILGLFVPHQPTL